ncbi:nucleolar protein,Nop52-domain-containing protein [Pseudoneurospora amorphoporcata]|uniref:Nucleolar protein,Nop52-domain-containing protein n=1 Tax=Pseudoneurospora amorphoporcata TaxID=241081 RepID=A0AAN6P6T5_9PEZI|nr:nucleolar protein,Nop52-domain-containing protein [Pseudoneurospora amorphoporcata]
MASPNMPFIKNLASSDSKIRKSALTSLQTFLSAKHIATTLSPIDILKLWKGLFYAMWMCDRAIPQQTLCQELADLIYILPRESVVPWLRGFWATMSREWTSIDVLRMEKFLLLVRRVVGASFRWMKGAQDGREDVTAATKTTKKGGKGKKDSGTEKTAWDAKRVDQILDMLAEWAFALDEDVKEDSESEESEPENDEDEDMPQHESLRKEKQQPQREKDPLHLLAKKIPAGLKIHVLDIWVDEAEKVGMLDFENDEEALKIVQRIIEQIEELEKRTVSPAIRVRSKDSLSDERLPGNEKKEPEEKEDEGWGGFDN